MTLYFKWQHYISMRFYYVSTFIMETSRVDFMTLLTLASLYTVNSTYPNTLKAQANTSGFTFCSLLEGGRTHLCQTEHFL